MAKKKLYEILSSNKEFAIDMFLKGTRSFTETGYVLITYGKYRYLEHRLVFYAKGITIPEGMEIHHIDSDKTNNRFDNLLILSSSEHLKLHQELVDVSRQLCFIGDN